MQTIFYSNPKKEKAIKSKVKKSFKRWRIGTALAALLLILAAVGACLCMAVIYPELSDSMYELSSVEGLLITAALALVFSIPAVLVFAWASSGGRRIIMARLNERIILDEDALCNQFSFKFKNSTNIMTDVAEYVIRYADIRDINWNKGRQRLEICCDYTYGQYARYAQGRTVDNYTSKTVTNEMFYFYNYFDDMEQLITQLRMYVGNTRGINKNGN